MKIAILAPLWKKVPPEKYGGSELVIANLAKGLTQLGHSVTIFACEGSDVAGKLVAVIDKPMYELVGGFDFNGIKEYEFLSFFELGRRINDFDIIHNHMGLHPISLAPLLPIPMITTLHSSLPPDFPSLAKAFHEYPFVSISNSQRKLAPELNYIATIYHGIDVKSFNESISEKNDGFVFLGTLSENKGIDIAVKTALELGKKLIIAGEVRDSDRGFLNENVFPYIDGKQISFIGEVGHSEKNILLANAEALLLPSRWNEAFGLVIVESLACGTPVVALNNGAVPEILRDGLTGYIADNEKDFIEAAKNVKNISRSSCRKDAEGRFDLLSMANSYVDVYLKSLKNKMNGDGTQNN
ncbi:MAG: hypothetical protein ACD_5C00032G0003 [uncultured bacterium]|nr:MAG: hypothetical protein ACD_5C00032G0003 [uncultured bacterium]